MLNEIRSHDQSELNATQGLGSDVSSLPTGTGQLRKLRLCFISNPNIIHTRRWVSWFARRGHTVCLLADVPPDTPWTDVPIVDLSVLSRLHLLRFAVWEVWLRRFIHQWQPDVLHAHRVNSAGWLAAFSGFHPVVVTPWGSDVLIAPQRSWVSRLLARYTLGHADCVTTISKAIRERVLSLNAKPERLITIYHGVDLEIFAPGPSSQPVAADIRQALSLPAGAPLIFSPRAVHPIYNLDIILQAVPRVLQRLPHAHFVFTAYQVDPAYKRELDDLVVQLGLGGSISWVPPTPLPGDMAERYRTSDVVVSVPSSDGGTPLTVLEAMACAKPVICSDLPALQDFLIDGENGWLVPVRQADSLADAILRILENPTQAAEFGRNARQLVAEKANLQVEMQRMEAIYYRLAGLREAHRHA